MQSERSLSEHKIVCIGCTEELDTVGGDPQVWESVSTTGDPYICEANLDMLREDSQHIPQCPLNAWSLLKSARFDCTLALDHEGLHEHEPNGFRWSTTDDPTRFFPHDPSYNPREDLEAPPTRAEAEADEEECK